MDVEAPAAAGLIEVVAGVVRDERGRVLLAQRPEGKHLAGTWEFPGGKREVGESGTDALARELDEELGIVVSAPRPWLAVTHRYPEITVRLQLFEVDDWRGDLRGREGQALSWVSVSEMQALPMPDADRPIIRAFELDERYTITPDPADLGGAAALLEWTRGCLRAGKSLFQLRASSLDEAALSDLARRFGELIAEHEARWLINGSPELAETIGADGVHLDGPNLLRLTTRPLSGDYLVAASCRDEADLARAGELALDFVTLSPVRSSADCRDDCRDVDTLGWEGFEHLCRFSSLPVYALGGITPGDLDRSRERGGFGVAGTRAFGVG